ncbi:Acylphosphatase [Candidatus Magnetomoraceae bacterium gMMP-15]
MLKKRSHLIISGIVQGVCFRMETRRAAMKYGVFGWVKNKSNGTVEAVFEGDEHQVKNIINWCHKGPPSAKVTNVSENQEDYKGEFNTFEITF